jgi:serine/threonine protein phosphatase 1
MLLDSPSGKRHRLPDRTRIYAIGDIHGRLDLFQKLVRMIEKDNALRPRAKVKMIVLGDFIDRGPDSAEVVHALQAIAAKTRNLVVLKGNHEQAMVGGLAGDFDALELWLAYGGAATLASWGVPEALIGMHDVRALLAAAEQKIPASVTNWMDRLPTTYRAGDYLFVHAGVRPGVPLDRQEAKDLLWIRGSFLESGEDHGAMIVHGHSIREEGADFQSNRIGIDTGAYRTGVLTALGIEADRCWTLST